MAGILKYILRMKKLHPAAAAVFIAGAVAAVLRHSSYSSHGPIDTGIFVVFLVFFWWLISDFSGGEGGADVNETASAKESIAFRFGRFLSRISRRG
ncbi:hypothetical protein NKJ90_19900 [Mesorhizobium sp. M0051]|uniref:hypothetical protein n=1 Tax=unclassified Mesorhizobium TaxID=325217 RepID=UPI0003CEF184|nr:hypothetical protein [Mesorhizobium sp. LNHC252B00]ESY76107.1 hypothetical protein X743_02425 [Mesorhizobium sp. LNHC252B00]